MDWTKPFIITNTYVGRVLLGAFAIEKGETFPVDNPAKYSEQFLKEVKKFLDMKFIKVENSTDFPSEMIEELPVSQVELDHSEHTVYNPETTFKRKSVIDVAEIDTSGKSIEVSELNDDGKAIEVAFNELDQAEAKAFLSQHWKTLEVSVSKVSSVKKLKFYLQTAKAMNLGAKKIQILQDKIKEITG